MIARISMLLMQLYFLLEDIVTSHHQNADDEPFDPEWMDLQAWKETRT